MAIGKTVGKLAEKMLNLTQKVANKLEDYGAKSAVENQNESAKIKKYKTSCLFWLQDAKRTTKGC